MREVIEENLNKSNGEQKKDFHKNDSSNEEIAISESNPLDNNVTEFETNKPQNELDDDLLQIPAFLRRQAN